VCFLIQDPPACLEPSFEGTRLCGPKGLDELQVPRAASRERRLNYSWLVSPKLRVFSNLHVAATTEAPNARAICVINTGGLSEL
jgi:hypothetical protein